MKTIAIVYGTRPEAIKLAPIVKEIRKQASYPVVVISTGQHTTLANQAEQSLGLIPDISLNLGIDHQTLDFSFTKTVTEISNAFREHTPALVVVQGDTTTAVATTLACFYLKIPVAHVEAGLRTHNKSSPFPEEVNRILIDQMSTLLFCPTNISKANLGIEGIYQNVYVTGNTIIDAFNSVNLKEVSFKEMSQPYILVTLHRRENFGTPMREICLALNKLTSYGIDIVLPVHPNPKVKYIVEEILSNNPKVHMLPPLSYLEFLKIASECKFIMSDSGGVQEEASLLHKPILVLRENTERPEILGQCGKLIGTAFNLVYQEAVNLINNPAEIDKMSSCTNPFILSDNSSPSINIVAHISQFLQ